MLNYSFYVETDPEDEDFFSIFIDSGEGSSAEIAGGVGEREVAELLLAPLQNLTQAEIQTLFKIKENQNV